MIWLEYARQQSGRLVHVGQAIRGKSNLSCPYCGREVLARQGDELSWHFAHAGSTCALARNKTRFRIPLYDDFFLGLSQKQIAALKYVHERGWVGVNGYAGERLLVSLTSRWLVRWNPYGRRHTGRHEVTKLGKIPLGILSVPLFAEIQAEKFKEFEEINNGDSPDSEIIRTHLRMLRRAWLYFLRVDVPGLPLLHKIGMTARDVEDRLPEIRADLTADYPDATAELLGAWPRMGRVERYAKFRFRARQYRLGRRTEYFAFDDVKPVLRELRRLA
jgi:hypothetical protein